MNVRSFFDSLPVEEALNNKFTKEVRRKTLTSTPTYKNIQYVKKIIATSIALIIG
jgi:hypothetical protein